MPNQYQSWRIFQFWVGMSGAPQLSHRLRNQKLVPGGPKMAYNSTFSKLFYSSIVLLWENLTRYKKGEKRKKEWRKYWPIVLLPVNNLIRDWNAAARANITAYLKGEGWWREIFYTRRALTYEMISTDHILFYCSGWLKIALRQRVLSSLHLV